MAAMRPIRTATSETFRDILSRFRSEPRRVWSTLGSPREWRRCAHGYATVHSAAQEGHRLHWTPRQIPIGRRHPLSLYLYYARDTPKRTTIVQATNPSSVLRFFGLYIRVKISNGEGGIPCPDYRSDPQGTQ